MHLSKQACMHARIACICLCIQTRMSAYVLHTFPGTLQSLHVVLNLYNVSVLHVAQENYMDDLIPGGRRSGW